MSADNTTEQVKQPLDLISKEFRKRTGWAVFRGIRVDLANAFASLANKKIFSFYVNSEKYPQGEVESALTTFVTDVSDKKLGLNNLLKETAGRPQYQQLSTDGKSVTERWELEVKPGILFVGVETITSLQDKEERVKIKENEYKDYKYEDGDEQKRNYYIRGAETNVGQRTLNRLSSLVRPKS
jgi:hypothetical protein